MLGLFKKKGNKILAAVADGECIPIEQVKDPVFSEKTLGDGIAMIPKAGIITAPCDGMLATVTETGHAFAMSCEDGLELMVHIGIDTVALNGQGFSVLAKEGSQVKKGQPVVEADLEFMEKNGIDMTTMLILLNGQDYEVKEKHYGKQLQKGVDTVIEYCQ